LQAASADTTLVPNTPPPVKPIPPPTAQKPAMRGGGEHNHEHAPLSRNPLYSSLPKLGHDAWRRTVESTSADACADGARMRPAYSWGQLAGPQDYAHQYNSWALYQQQQQQQQAAAELHQSQMLLRNLFPYTTVNYGNHRSRTDLLAHLLAQQQHQCA
jgi:hypothetical protein